MTKKRSEAIPPSLSKSEGGIASEPERLGSVSPEVERLEQLRQEMLNAYQGEQHSINHFLTNLEEVYAHIAALQAKVEQGARREAALRKAFDSAMQYAPPKDRDWLYDLSRIAEKNDGQGESDGRTNDAFDSAGCIRDPEAYERGQGEAGA